MYRDFHDNQTADDQSVTGSVSLSTASGRKTRNSNGSRLVPSSRPGLRSGKNYSKSDTEEEGESCDRSCDRSCDILNVGDGYDIHFHTFVLPPLPSPPHLSASDSSEDSNYSLDEITVTKPKVQARRSILDNLDETINSEPSLKRAKRVQEVMGRRV